MAAKSRFVIERDRETIRTGEKSTEVTYAATSLPAQRADAEQLSALIREHWHIENCNHHVRDFTYDEDRCRARVRNLPQNLAALTNIAISIIRLHGRFEFIPEVESAFRRTRPGGIGSDSQAAAELI